MILQPTTSAQRAVRAFTKWTRISLQVRGGATVTLAHEQGEAQNLNDGVQITQATTNPPYDTWWKGELWFAANAAGSSLVLIIVGEADTIAGGGPS
jgi:hypothetical protein